MIFLLFFSPKKRIYSHHLLQIKIVCSRELVLNVLVGCEDVQIVSKLSSYFVLCYKIPYSITFHQGL